jgi:hypothetical protein
MSMPRGGHAASGPAPDPNALRRDRPGDAATWTTLPAEGRQGPAPEWPLIEADGREWELWAELWSMPQAIMWERLGQRYEVALYVRMLARAEQPKSSIELQKVVRQYLDSLGLSTQGMLRHRWRLSANEVAEKRATKTTKAPARPSMRDRLKAIDGGGA